MQPPIHKFIRLLRETDPAVVTVYKSGACYQLAPMLQSLYPNGYLVINTERDHAAYLHGAHVYDIDGAQPNSTDWHLMTQSHIELASKWSFSHNSFLQIGECPICDEPLLTK